MNNNTRPSCPKCNSENTVKMGLTQSKTPKQKHFCKKCYSFFVGSKLLLDELEGKENE